MNRCLMFIFVITLLLNMTGAVLAEQKFPPPDFESGYTLPETVVAPPQAAFYDILDVLVLLTALSLASWLALKKRSRNGIFALMAFSLFYFGFCREGCICSIGAIQNVAMAMFDRSYTIPLTAVVFFLLPLVFTLFFGRVFCAAVCPLGAIQDVVLVKPVTVPGWLEGMLRLLAYLYLGAAILFAATGSAFIICQYDPFVPIFRMSGSFDILVLGGSFLVVGLFVGRPYCRFFCPYGILLRFLSKFSRWRVSITPAECVQCRLCEESCPYGAIQSPQEPKQLVNPFLAKLTFAGLLVLVPVLIFAGSLAGGSLSNAFSRMHETVRLADQIYSEEVARTLFDTSDPNAVVKIEMTEASEAFRATGQGIDELMSDSAAIKKQFVIGCRWLGGFIGLVLAFKLLQLRITRGRNDYLADRGQCLACGRCFDYCPVEKVNGTTNGH